MKKGLPFAIMAAVIAVTICGCDSASSSDNNSSNTTTGVTSEAPVTSGTENTESTPDSSDSDFSQTESFVQETPGASHGISSEQTENSHSNGISSMITATAEAMVGIDFATGGASPEEGFDNSGFIYYVLRENGYINCPRSTAEQKKMGTIVGFTDIKAGDLVFFVDKESASEDDPGFGGIYIGDGKLVYSPYPGEKVKFADINSTYWKSNFDCAVRVA